MVVAAQLLHLPNHPEDEEDKRYTAGGWSHQNLKFAELKAQEEVQSHVVDKKIGCC